MMRAIRSSYNGFCTRNGNTPIVMKVDLENGYGEVKIADLLERLYTSEKTKGVARHIYTASGLPVTVCMRTEKLMYEELFKNKQSLMQGDLLSPAYFSLAIMPHLEAAREEIRQALGCPDIDYFSYIDDIVWILPDRDDARNTVCDVLSRHLKTVHSRIKPSKTLVLYPTETRVMRARYQFPDNEEKRKAAATAEFIDILGTPFVGEPDKLTPAGEEAVQMFVYDRMMDGSRGQMHKHRLQSMRSEAWGEFLSAAPTVIRRSILPSTAYIVRNTPKRLSSRAVTAMDTEVELTIRSLVRIKEPLTQNQRTVVSLPLAHGGLGILKLEPLVEHMVLASKGPDERVLAKQKILAHHHRMYEGLMTSLLDERENERDPLAAAAANMMLDHLEDYDPTAKMTRNTSGKYIFQADSVEAGPLTLKIYGMLGHIPPKRSPHFTCSMCKCDIPLEHRLDHGARCERICRVQRHDGVREEAMTKARHAADIRDVKGEETFPFAPNIAAAEFHPPDEIVRCRSDMSFITTSGDKEPKPLKVRVDFGITVGGKTGRWSMDRRKKEKYERIKQYTTEQFVMVNAIMDTRGTMEPECEQLLRFIATRHLLSVSGSWSDARVQAYLGSFQARALQREYTMYMLTEAGLNRDPAVVFDSGILEPSAPTVKNWLEGRISERKLKRELAKEELAADAVARAAVAQLVDKAEGEEIIEAEGGIYGVEVFEGSE